MSIRDVARKQVQNAVEKNSVHARKLFQPRQSSEGWIKLMRQAFGMSGAQLGRKMGVTRALISNTEKAETEGRVTIKKMQEFANAMDCEFVYCMIPRGDIQSILKQRAVQKAQAIALRTNKHMGLEGQALSNKNVEIEIERLATEFLKNESSDLWND
jgi:predicted DNA-binding mobile mystery protein A